MSPHEELTTILAAMQLRQIHSEITALRRSEKQMRNLARISRKEPVASMVDVDKIITDHIEVAEVIHEAICKVARDDSIDVVVLSTHLLEVIREGGAR